MGQAIGQILPLALGVALSPVPIIAVILVLVTPRARSNGPAFVVGWLLGLSLVGVLVLVVADPANASNGGEPVTWVEWLKLVLGVLVVLIAVKQWRGRPRGDDEPATPKWMGAIDDFTPVKSFAAGAVLSAANPKNLLLAVAAAASIAEASISGADQAVDYAIFALIGSIGVAVPVVVFFSLGDRAPAVLDSMKAFMARNNAVIMAVLCLIIGAKLVGDAITGLTA